MKYILDFKLIERLLIEPVITAAGSCAVYLLSALLSSTNILQTKVCQVLLRDSFGIYLYADPLNYPILAMGFAWLGSRLFTDMLPSICLYAVRVFGTIMISLMICHIIRRSKLRYLC